MNTSYTGYFSTDPASYVQSENMIPFQWTAYIRCRHKIKEKFNTLSQESTNLCTKPFLTS